MIFRHDNAPHERWKYVKTFPKHFHNGNLRCYPFKGEAEKKICETAKRGLKMVRFTEHARDRLNEYGIPQEDVNDVLKKPEKVFLDVKTGRFIAIRSWKDKHLVVVFESYEGPVVVTVFPTSKINKVLKRVETGRWIEL